MLLPQVAENHQAGQATPLVVPMAARALLSLLLLPACLQLEWRGLRLLVSRMDDTLLYGAGSAAAVTDHVTIRIRFHYLFVGIVSSRSDRNVPVSATSHSEVTRRQD
jgi:hypothetical protein